MNCSKDNELWLSPTPPSGRRTKSPQNRRQLRGHERKRLLLHQNPRRKGKKSTGGWEVICPDWVTWLLKSCSCWQRPVLPCHEHPWNDLRLIVVEMCLILRRHFCHLAVRTVENIASVWWNFRAKASQSGWGMFRTKASRLQFDFFLNQLDWVRNQLCQLDFPCGDAGCILLGSPSRFAMVLWAGHLAKQPFHDDAFGQETQLGLRPYTTRKDLTWTSLGHSHPDPIRWSQYTEYIWIRWNRIHLNALQSLHINKFSWQFSTNASLSLIWSDEAFVAGAVAFILRFDWALGLRFLCVCDCGWKTLKWKHHAFTKFNRKQC